MGQMLRASSTTPWTCVVSEKLFSSLTYAMKATLVRVGSTSIAFESWTDIPVCCFFGVTLSDPTKKIVFRQLSDRTWPGSIERRASGKTMSQQDPHFFCEILGDPRCLYSAELRYKYLSTFLNGPMVL